MKMNKSVVYLIILFTILNVGISFAQQTTEELAKKVANPISHMISVPFQTNFLFNINSSQGGENGYKIIMNLQPILPVVLSKDLNLINRVILPLITQKDVTARNQKEEGIGDVLYTGFFSPSVSKVLWGVGPTVSLPTATNEFLGTKKLSVGPSVVILGQPGKWTIGGLVNQLWSVAGDKNRANIKVGYFQPFISYRFKGGLSAGISSENTYDWNSKRLISGVASFNVSQIIRIATAQIASVQFSYLVFYGNDEVKMATWGIRTTLTFIFQKKLKDKTQN
jgi:hypothetical protein